MDALKEQKNIHQGSNISYFRYISGLTQKDLANKLNNTQQYVSHVEQSETLKPEVITAFAEALKIDSKFITDFDSSKPENAFFFDKVDNISMMIDSKIKRKKQSFIVNGIWVDW